MSDAILFIVEGKTTEKTIIKNINKKIFNSDKYKIYPYSTNIYCLWNEFQRENSFLDNSLDMYDFILDKIENDSHYDINVGDFSRIYLFFDYDGHHPQASNSVIQEMLSFFDNETETGKLFISYPMAEALKHIHPDNSFGDNIVPINLRNIMGISYKEMVRNDGHKNYRYFNSYNKDIWRYIIEENHKKAHFIVHDKYEIPNHQIQQEEIFGKQLEKFIAPQEKVAVLSGFPLFLIDFYGENLEKTFCV